MDFTLIIIFWYGVLHAFGPDHLTAIADFSIGKNKKTTLMVTILFAVGHGISLLIFAEILKHFIVDETILSYADLIAASIIIFMGIYFLYLVINKKINIGSHNHDGQKHTHIYFGDWHEHKRTHAKKSSFIMGTLMGIGGVRGMIVSLALLNGSEVGFLVVLSFTLGVILVFTIFGLLISYVNATILKKEQYVYKIFTSLGIVSIAVGSNILFF